MLHSPTEERLAPIEHRERIYGRWYAVTWSQLPGLFLQANEIDDPEARRRVQLRLARFAQVEVDQFFREYRLPDAIINKYGLAMLAAAYCGLEWAGRRIAETAQIERTPGASTWTIIKPYPINAWWMIVGEMHRIMQVVWKKIGPHALAQFLPKEVWGAMKAELKETRILPSQYRREVLLQLTLARLDERDRQLAEEVQAFIRKEPDVTGRPREFVPNDAWSKVSAILTLKGVKGMSLTPGSLEKRYYRLRDRMDLEYEFLNAMTEGATPAAQN